GLIPLLKSIHRQRHIKDFSGQTVGIDAYGWLHRGAIACAIDLALGKPTQKYVDFCMHRVRMLLHFGVTPYLVFDGDYLPSKASTELAREARREETRKLGLDLLAQKKTSEAYTELRKAIDVTPTMAAHVIAACRALNVQCVVAPYEADAQLYYMERTGIISGIISEDSDLLVFGAKSLITKLGEYGDCVEINRADFASNKDVSLAGWSNEEFRMMAILSGCDYLENIPNIGLRTAYGLVRKHKTIDRIIKVLRFDGKYSVPTEYEIQFEKAETTFRHQRVWCPVKEQMVMCNDAEEGALTSEQLVYIGPELEHTVARSVAEGKMDPITKTPIVLDGPLVKVSLPEFEAGSLLTWI
ncbi:PIN domain-like protein, partial [Ascobolus immersus RN42]